MTILKILCALVVAVIAVTIFGKVRQNLTRAPATAAANELSPAGFFLLTRADAGNRQVVIVTPPDCPSEEAARARALAGSLQAAGIPCQLQSEISATFDNPEDTARVSRHMANLAQPLVIVRGWAKGNPTSANVIAQYRANPN